MIQDKAFDAPIPGQSLTGSPKAHAWERPPETVDPEVAIVHHIERLSQPDVEDNVMDAIQFGLPISYITDLALTGGVANGIHTIDVSIIIAPVIHEYVRSIAESAGLPYKEFWDKDEDKFGPEQKKRLALEAINKAIDEAEEPDPGTNLLEEMKDSVETVEEIPEEVKTPKRGLMARRAGDNN